MHKTPIADAAKPSINPALLAFKPRQVQLLSKPTTMNQEDIIEKTPLLIADQNSLLLLSIAHYLERNGFGKTLKKFLSEASLQKGDLEGGSFLDLEEMFCKFLEIRVHDVKKFESSKVQGVSKGDGHGFAVALETLSQRQRKEKRSNKSDDSMDREDRVSDAIIDSKRIEESVRLDALPVDVKSKEKKRKKKNSDSPEQEEQVKEEVHKEPTNHIVCEHPHKKCKDKKKKKGDSELLPRTTEEKPIDAVVLEGNKVAEFETENRSKDKKKKKNKLSSDPVDDVGKHVSEDKHGDQVNEGESLKDSQVVDSVMLNANNVLLENRKAKSEGKKKKKDATASESVCGVDLKEPEGKWKENDSTKDDSRTSNGDEKHAKSSKKRKRLASEDAGQFADGKALADAKCMKSEIPEEPNMSEQRKKLKSSSGCGEKEQEEKTSSDVCIESQKTPAKQLDGQVDGNLEEKSTITMMKQQNGSVQPKSVKHFQRIKVDDVAFSDEKLKDNSYWAKDGAENGYGAKAQEVLGQVKGRDFRHEKTKKKRGSYRGGQIDLQSHSVKFNYSDED